MLKAACLQEVMHPQEFVCFAFLVSSGAVRVSITGGEASCIGIQNCEHTRLISCTINDLACSCGQGDKTFQG